MHQDNIGDIPWETCVSLVLTHPNHFSVIRVNGHLWRLRPRHCSVTVILMLKLNRCIISIVVVAIQSPCIFKTLASRAACPVQSKPGPRAPLVTSLF